MMIQRLRFLRTATRPIRLLQLLPLLALLVPTVCQAQTATGPQQLAFAGLRSVANQGQFNAVKADAAGNLFLLLDQKDGVRVLKTDPTATTLLAQSQLGAAGDTGLSLALDPAGNVYVAGTTTSTTLTGTAGTAFPNRADTSTNSFIAKYDTNLNRLFVTFAGSGNLSATSVAATPDAVFLTGSLFAATLPATSTAYQQVPATGSFQHGFVERFSADGSTLVYATYLTGANGDTFPVTLTADSSDNAYIAGSTSATGFPTLAALVPAIQSPAANSTPSSGFLTKLTPAGDALLFSTFIPGSGVTSLALDPTANNLILSGSIALGAFPVANVQSPLIATQYQVLERLSLDGSSVLSSTLLAPGVKSFVTPAPNGTAWADGPFTNPVLLFTTPLLPVVPLATLGASFAARITAQGTIDQTARFGGLASTSPANASAPVTLTSLATDAAGNPFLAGAFTPTASSTLLATQRYDLPLVDASTAVLPSSITDTAPTASSCSESLCSGSAAYLARLTTGTAAPSLVFSIGASPDIILRNLGSAQATGLQLTAAGFTLATTCAASLSPGAECSIALTGSGPGTLSAQATNALTQTVSLPASTTTPTAIVFSPRELDFGIQTLASSPILRTITVTNLSPQTQSFTSALDALTSRNTPASPFTESTSDCPSPTVLTSKTLAAGATCHITLALALTSNPTDGPLQALWKIATTGSHDVLLTAYANSAALSTSSAQIDFETQFTGGPRSPRFLYLSNNSDTSVQHTPATLSGSSPFTLTDRCPTTILPHSVCQIQFAYESPTTPSSDALTLPLDQGLSVFITGRTLPQPLGTIGTTNPNLTVTPTTVTFANSIPVTTQSSGTQTVSIANTGSSDLPLALSLTGDFTDATSCTSTLAAHQTCNVVLTFAPTAPGTRTGLLTVTSTSGNDPIYVGISATATPILNDSSGNTIQGTPTIDFGSVYITQPVTQWFKVSQPFQSFTATATGAFTVILVEDIGFGHGSPAPTAYHSTTTGTCTNCFLGVQFKPTTTGPQSGSLSLTSATNTNAYGLPLTGTGQPLTGLLVSPATQDLGMVPVHSTSQPFLFALTNLLTTNTAVTLTAPTVTGDFAISPAPTGGPACTGTLSPASTCFVLITLSPTATGTRSGTLTFPTSSGNIATTVSGTGQADPGISLTPNALTFQPLPGSTATQQTVTIGNTGSANLQIGALTSTSAAFSVTGTCGTLAPTATCTATVTFTPTAVQTSATLQLPVTVNQTLTTYTVPLTGAYTGTTASLQILPAQTNFGPSPVDTVGPTRTFTINNLTAKQQTVTLNLPRHFALATPNPCTTLAANASCTFNVTSLPLTAADTTGTINAQATAAGIVTTAVAYLQSYGTNSTATALRVTGSLSPGTGFFDFGQVASGQSRTQTLTLTNISTTSQTLTLRRIASQPPFLATTTCGTTLTPAQTCTVSVTYSPINQVPTGSASSPAIANTGTLTIESDDSASPTIIDLTGSAAPVAVTTPNNTSPVATYTLSQSSRTFPNTAVGNISPTQTVTVTNTGTTTLHIGTLTTTADFTVTDNCIQPVIAGAACTLTLSFTPTALGVRASALEIVSDSGIALDFITLLGVSYPSSLLVTPQSIDFGSILVNSSSTTQAVQITNNGQVPVTLASLTAGGDYTVSSNCPTTLAPSNTCTAQVVFRPTAPGTRTGTFTVTNSASTLPLTTSLTGVGLQSHLTANPVLAAFGNVGVGSSLDLAITLTNTGTAPLGSLALAITGDYTIATPCSTATLGPAQTCRITLTFTPATVGSRPGTLTITSTDSTSPLQIPLTGTGIQSHLQLAPTTLAFGTVPLGTTNALPITLTNTGTASITSLTPTIAGDFTIMTPCGTATLAPNQSCTLTILFTPTATGPRVGTLTLTDSDPASPTSIALTGTGTTTPSHLQITPTALTFGSVTVASSANLSLTVSNTGTTSITSVALAISGDYAVTTPCPATLPAAQSCSINIAFTPNATGIRTGTLTITSTDSTSPSLVSLTGTGTAAPTQPRLQITPTALAFGTVSLGTSASLTATLGNPGSTSITAIALAATGDYTQTSTCGAILAPAQTCTATVTFAPTTLGSRNGSLTITSSDPSSPTIVPLTGNASAATSRLQITPVAPNFGSVAIGSSNILAVTVTNTSLTTITSITLTTTGDYTLTSTCSTLTPAQTCTANITFTPTALGNRPGSLTITSSDPASPLTFPLTGAGTATPTTPGSFTLTVNGASTASASVPSGSTATYNLTVTPTGGFTGPVVFNCTPLTSATYSSCAMLPSTVTLSAGPQSATLTITTLTSLAAPSTTSTLAQTPATRVLLCLLAPGALLILRRKRTRRLPLLLLSTLLSAATLAATGCGGGPNLTLRYVNPGTYQYQVTASSTATVPITQTVTVSLIITNN